MTRRSIEWLSRAADDPALCQMAWRDDPRAPYLLGAGRLFDVVATDHRTGTETLDQLRLHGMQVGPVMADRAAGRVGFLLPAGSQERFERSLAQQTEMPPAYRFLSLGSYVVAPGPMALTGDRFEWMNAPVRPQHGSPLQVVSLAVMFAAAALLIGLADSYGQGMSHAGR
jgi:hypothetical protein